MPPEDTGAMRKESARQGLEPATILVAASDSFTRNLMRHALNFKGVDLVEAVDGVEALTLLRRRGFDLVVLDAFLAVVDGISLCIRIGEQAFTPPPAIILTGLNSERGIEQALDAGADEVLSRPFRPSLIRARAEAALRRRQQESRLRLLERAIEAAAVGVTVLQAVSPEYQVSYSNPAFRALTGYEEKDLTGKSLRLLVGPDTDVGVLAELRAALSQGHTARLRLKNYRKDGTVFGNDLCVDPLRDEDGHVTHFVVVHNESMEKATQAEEPAPDDGPGGRLEEMEKELRRLDDQRRFNERLLNQLLAAVIAVGAERRVTFANRAAQRLLGLSLADCLNRQAAELFGDPPGLATALDGLLPGQERRMEFPSVSPSGRRSYVGATLVRVPEDGERGDEIEMMLVFRDMVRGLDEEVAGEFGRAGLGQAAHDNPSLETIDPTEILSRTRGGLGEAARPFLALRYLEPERLVRRALALLGGLERSVAVKVEGALPRVLVDGDRVTEALVLLLNSALRRRGGEAQSVQVFLSGSHGEGVTTQPGAFVRVDVLYGREEIGLEDLDDSESGYEPDELETARGLISANGGVFLHATPANGPRSLTALLPAPHDLPPTKASQEEGTRS